MKQINVVLNVDEDIILNESGQESLDDAISQELGWLHDSGIFVESWSFAEPEKDREQRLINEVLNYFAEHHDSSELYRIFRSELEMSHEDIELLGFDLPQCYENEEFSVGTAEDEIKPSLSDQIHSASNRASEAHPAEQQPVKAPSFER